MVDVDRGTVEQAVRCWDRSAEVVEYRKYESGRARDVFRVVLESGNVVVLYLCTDTGEYEDRFRKEEGVIELVNEQTDIPTQQLLHVDMAKDTVPYLFYIADEVEGYNPVDRYKYLPREQKRTIVQQVGRYLGELHREATFSHGGEIRYRNGRLVIEGSTWQEYLQDWAIEKIEEFDGTPFADLQDDMRDFLDSYLYLADDSYICCVHYDITPDNLIVDREGINAVIDWEKAIAAPPEWDLFYARIMLAYRFFETDAINRQLTRDLLEGYRETFHLRDDWRTRLLFFDTVWSFKPMTNISQHPEPDEATTFFRDLFTRRYGRFEEAAEQEIIDLK